MDDSLFIDDLEVVTEYVPVRRDPSLLVMMRQFLNELNNELFILLKNSNDALKQTNRGDRVYDHLKSIAKTIQQLDAMTKDVQVRLSASVFRGTETILIVDDGEQVRELLAKILRERGYTPLEASSGADALSVCEGYPGPIHLALVDIAMQPMNGYDLVNKLLLIRPTIKVIYMSGDFLDHRFACPGGAFLKKPTQLLEGLPQKVWEILNLP